MSTYTNQNYGAANYQKFRPTYPKSLYEHLRKYTGSSDIDVIVDLACGTGQATRVLEKMGNKVFGVDNSEVMIKEAIAQDPSSNINFIVGNDSTITAQFKENSVDILTVAEALHWMTFPDFWSAAHEILKPNGVLAFWSYYNFSLVHYPEVADVLRDLNLNHSKLGKYWDPGQSRLNDLYQSLDLPSNLFKDEERCVNDLTQLRPSENFELIKEMTLGDVFRLLHTWSAYHNWKLEHPDNRDILDETAETVMRMTGIRDLETVVLVKWETVYSFSRAVK